MTKTESTDFEEALTQHRKYLKVCNHSQTGGYAQENAIVLNHRSIHPDITTILVG